MNKAINIIVIMTFFSIFPVFIEYNYLKYQGFEDFVDIDQVYIKNIENGTVEYYLNRTSRSEYSSDFYRSFNIIDADEERIISNIALPSIVIPEGYDEFIATYKVGNIEPGNYYMEVEYTLNLDYGIKKTISIDSPIYYYEGD